MGAGACGSEIVIVGAPPPPLPPPDVEAADAERPPAAVAIAPNESRVAGASACDMDARIAALGRGCERLRSEVAVGTGAARSAAAAFDGDACSVWNAGDFAPQSATVDLGAPAAIAAILLVPEMSPARAAVAHRIEVSDDGRSFQRVGEVRAAMQTGELVELPIPGGVTARFLRVTTTESPSWVAWREIAVLRCGGLRR